MLGLHRSAARGDMMSTSVETEVGQLVWHTLLTPEVGRAKAFYAELCGWEYETFKPGELDVPMIMAGGTAHGGFMAPEAPGVPPHWIAYAQVEDVDSAAERATRAGGAVLAPPSDIPDVGRVAVLADPQGASLAVFTPGQEMGLPQGVFAWDELLTTDVEEAKAFYGSVIGWGNATWGEQPYTLLKSPTGQDVAGLMEKPAEDPGPPRWLTYLVTDDVDETVEKARNLGAAVYLEHMDVPDIGTIAVLGDPTGAEFGLYKIAAH
jgi:predicted enzyme related to lactoylglutathione lyase